MNRYAIILIVVFIVGFVVVDYFYSQPTVEFPLGLETQVVNAVTSEKGNMWDKIVTIEQLHPSEDAALGKWAAKDYWGWIAWRESDEIWRVLISTDGYNCEELDTIPTQYQDFFADVTHSPNGNRYCYIR